MTIGVEAPASRLERASVVVAAVAAIAPIAVAVTRALHRGWYPVGDNAYFSLRARDVLTDHHPLLGTWTSASYSVGEDINNPGPLLFDLLALPAKIAPIGGIAVGTAVLNALCLVVMALIARRGGGAPRAAGVLLAGTALLWSMGSELSFDPWQPHALLLPFLLFLVTVWRLAEGAVTALPWAVGVASLLVQTHLSYAVLVPVLGLLGVTAVVWRLWRSDEGPKRWVPARRPVAIAALVAVVCWVQPLVEQLTAPEGNLARLVSSGGAGDDPTIGPALAARFVAGTALVPPAWARPSFGESFRPPPLTVPADGLDLAHTPSAATAVAVLVLVAGGLGGVAWTARRRRDGGAVAGVVVVAAAMALALATTATLPIGRLGIGPHQVRWLWPISVLLPVVLVLGVLGRCRWTAPALAAAALVLGCLSLPTYDQQVGPTADSYAMPVMAEVARQLDGIDVDGPVLFADEDLEALPIFEPYSTPLMLELTRRGIDIVVDDPSQARQLGEDRRHPERATQRLLLRLGDRALEEPPPGARRIASVAGLGPAERATLDRLVERLRSRPDLAVTLTADGRRAAERGRLPGISPSGTVDPDEALPARSLVVAQVSGFVAAAEERRMLAPYVELQRRWDRETLEIYLAPVRQEAVP